MSGGKKGGESCLANRTLASGQQYVCAVRLPRGRMADIQVEEVVQEGESWQKLSHSS